MTVLELSDALLIGRGNRRVVYRHPEDAALCLKVPLPARGSDRPAGPLRRLLGRGEEDENRADAAALARVAPAAAALARFPRIHGFVETSRGPALVTECVRDHDGAVSMTLSDWVAARGPSPELIRAIVAFRDRLAAAAVVTRTLSPRNVVVSRPASDVLELRVVDGFGGRDRLPLNRLPFVARARVRASVRNLGEQLRRLPGWPDEAARALDDALGRPRPLERLASGRARSGR